uniref:Polypeptide N-acetylgalactosaminyltransferase n=1 Tax=Aceria tosichella TaxID=561515 RepID=A0A6G1SJB9_9ACAR
MGRQSPLLVQYASQTAPYVEMLVPRRKGQLLKLLILVPLSLLLAISIYYQFYYEPPPGIILPQPGAEPLVAFSGPGNFDPSAGANEMANEPAVAAGSSGLKNTQNKSDKQQEQQKENIDNSNNNRNLNDSPPLGNDLDKLDGGDIGESESESDLDQPVAQRHRPLARINKEQLRQHEQQQQHEQDRSAKTTTIELQREAQEANEAQDAAVLPAPSEPNGPGEMGRPVVLKNLTKEQQQMVNVGWENNAFNQYVSDIISLNRSLPDVRDPACKPLKYPDVNELPPTSVIICFHNEAWSVLLRTVHSVLNRSPRRLVKEIILVDDFSNKAYLGQQLDDYVKQLKVVKVVRAKKREGLIRARLLGAEQATAPVLTFLDSHCECAEGWLEPLLARIHEDPQAVVCPVIDVISDKTFEYHYKGDANAVSVGGFDWNLQFNWHGIPERERKRRKHPTDPLRSPTMAGGLFSIDKAFFERLGTYDSGFDIWGGENLELSFKTWMCGGTLEIVPCSHVGHVFRSRSPYKWRTGVNVLRRNSVRLAEVWMDDYKRYYYDRIGHELGDYGDVSERLELRRRLKCKPFSYFVKEIYPELFIPGEAIAYGEIRNDAEGHIKMCVDSSARKSDYHKPLGLYPCHGSGGNQYWLLSREGEIRRDEACVDYAGKDVVLFPCHGSGGNQLWIYDNKTQLIRHGTSGRCMEYNRVRIRLKMSDCDPNNDAQRWIFQNFNATLAAIYRTSSSQPTPLV